MCKNTQNNLSQNIRITKNMENCSKLNQKNQKSYEIYHPGPLRHQYLHQNLLKASNLYQDLSEHPQLYEGPHKDLLRYQRTRTPRTTLKLVKAPRSTPRLLKTEDQQLEYLLQKAIKNRKKLLKNSILYITKNFNWGDKRYCKVRHYCHQ